MSANTGIASLDEPVDGTDVRNLYFARLDQDLSGHHLSGRFNRFDRKMPNDGVGGSVTTSGAILNDWVVQRYNAGLDSVFAGRWVNQFLFTFLDTYRKFNRMSEGPQYSFPSLAIGGRPNAGHEVPSYWFIRNDVSYFFEKAGQHNLKFGGEYEHGDVQGFFANAANGQFFYNQEPAEPRDVLRGRSISRRGTRRSSRFRRGSRRRSATFRSTAPNNIYSAYVQDDWTLGPRLTLNLGLRYDLEFGSLANDVTGLTTSPHENDINNFQPRLGFAWDLNGHGRTVVRGGGGLYYDQVFLNVTFNQIRSNSGQQVTVTTFNTTNDPGSPAIRWAARTFEDFKQTSRAPSTWLGVADGRAAAARVDLVDRHRPSDHDPTWPSPPTMSARARIRCSRSIDSNLFCCLPDGNALPITTGTFPELGGPVRARAARIPRYNIIQDYLTNGRSRYQGLQVGAEQAHDARLPVRRHVPALDEPGQPQRRLLVSEQHVRPR